MKRLVFLALGAMFACFARADSAFATTQEKGGTFPAGMKVLSGITSYANIVPGSFQISAGGYVWNDDGSGKLVFTNPNAGASSSGNDETTMLADFTGSGTILYSSGAWSILINPAMSVSSVATVRYSYYTGATATTRETTGPATILSTPCRSRAARSPQAPMSCTG